GGRRGVRKSRDRLNPAVSPQSGEVGASQVERRVRGAPGCPTEADVAVVRLDTADQPKAVPGELLLRGLNHRIDCVDAVAAAVRIDVTSVLGPCLGDEIAPTLRVSFVPGGEIVDYQLVDVAHGDTPFVWLHERLRFAPM